MKNYKFKDVNLMTTQSMKAECKSYLNKYVKLIAMPESIVSRFEILMKEIGRKELIDFEEKEKSERLKATEAKKMDEQEQYNQILEANKQCVLSIIKYLRENSQTGSSSFGDIELKRK